LKGKRKIAVFLTAVLLSGGMGQARATELEETYRNVKVLEVEGDGTASLEREELEMPAYAQMVIQGGDVMTTDEETMVDFQLDDDKYAVMEELSEVEFELEGKKNKGAIHIYLNEGSFYTDIENALNVTDALTSSQYWQLSEMVVPSAS